MRYKKIAGFCLLFTLFCCRSFTYAQTQEGAEIPKDYQELKQLYETVVNDRENLLSQMKILLEYKKEIEKARHQMGLIEAEREQWELEKESLKSANNRLQLSIDQSLTKVDNLQADLYQMQEERDNLRQTLSKSKADYIIVDDLNRKVKEQEKEIKRLEKNIERMSKDVEKASDNTAKAEAKADVLRGQVSEIKAKYKEALATNKKLEKEANRLPQEYAEVARENKVLLKRTALMHYNLGVFYTKNKEYTRAIAEFEKAIELNQEDPQAYFNLGFIYAEYYENRAKAIDNFKKFLSLTKKEDEDVDWVKKYILTWQTWEGKSFK